MWSLHDAHRYVTLRVALRYKHIVLYQHQKQHSWRAHICAHAPAAGNGLFIMPQWQNRALDHTTITAHFQDVQMYVPMGAGHGCMQLLS